MKLSSFLYFAKFGIKTVLLRKKDPILGTIILTDKCNLKCRHCSVNNITAVIHPYEQIKQEMKLLYEMGVRILFFCGGETFLWQGSGKKLRDLGVEGQKAGVFFAEGPARQPKKPPGGGPPGPKGGGPRHMFSSRRSYG